MPRRPEPDPRIAEIARRRLEQLRADVGATARPTPAAPGSGPPGRHARRSLGRRELVGGWLHDRVPPMLQGRLALGGSQLTVLALAVALGMAVAAWWALRVHGSETVVAVSAPTRPATSPADPAAAAAAVGTPSTAVSGGDVDHAAGVVVVDVSGRVRHPGIATLPAGSRVVDALRAAGGVRPGVDLSGLNRARLLVDGEQLLVGVHPPAGPAATALSSPGAASPTTLVNLNTADQPTLETLPGVGPVTATAILQWRSDNGSFRSVDELLDVSGIGEATLAELAPLVTV